jgi:tRNA-dihydrouridine synthase
MVARGSFGNPWIFEELLGDRTDPPERAEVSSELLWVIDRAEEHFGSRRGAHYLRKFYPWYVERLGIAGPDADALQRTEDLEEVRRVVAEAGAGGVVREHASVV